MVWIDEKVYTTSRVIWIAFAPPFLYEIAFTVGQRRYLCLTKFFRIIAVMGTKPPFYKRPAVLAVATAILVIGAFALAKLHIISFVAQGVITAVAVGIQVALYRQKKE